GATSGFTSDLIFYPDHDLVISSTSNIFGGSQFAEVLPSLIAETLLDLPKSDIDWVEDLGVPLSKSFYDRLLAPTDDLPPKIPKKPATFANNLSAYVGEYSDPQFGTFVIGLEKGNKTTTLTYKFNEFTSTLKHYHNDAFVASLDEPLFHYDALITFSTDPVSGRGRDKKKQSITRMQIQEVPGAMGISKKVFKKRRV
ncbi:hypothetical protein BGX24_005913, partial [Mortierella sp. AD032]